MSKSEKSARKKKRILLIYPQEGRLGSLDVERHAGVIILSEDCFSVRNEAIKDVRSVRTVIGERVVHAEAEFAALDH
jgi:predicted amidohydrolase YtcJ